MSELRKHYVEEIGHDYENIENTHRYLAELSLATATELDNHRLGRNNDFSHLTLTKQIKQVANCFEVNHKQNIRIIGSSFGGLTAAWLGEKYSQIDSIILLAPAFNFKNHWLVNLTTETLQQWQEKGYLPVYHYGENRELPLHYQFLTDLSHYEQKKLKQSIPTLILHGINDEVISIHASRQYTKNRPWVKLIELESDHSLTDVMPIISKNITQFWQL